MSTVFAASALNAKLTNNPDDNLKLLSVDRTKNEKVYNTGGGTTTYRKLNCKSGDKKVPLKIHYKANPEKGLHPIIIVKGIEDPNSDSAKEKRKDNPNKVDLSFETSLSKSGIFGEVMSKVHSTYMKDIKSKNTDSDPKEAIVTVEVGEMEDPENPGKMVKTFTTKREIKSPYITHYGSSDKVPIEKRKQPKPDPTIRLKLDFSRYSAAFGKLANTPKSIVRNYEEKDGNSYRIARVDGKLIDKDNAYKVVTGGSLIHEIRADIASVAITDKYVTIHAHVDEMTIESRDNSGFVVVDENGEVIAQGEAAELNPEDRYDVDNSMQAAPMTAPVPTSAPAPSTTLPTPVEVQNPANTVNTLTPEALAGMLNF